MQLGDYQELTVLRETPIAYLLTDGNQEVFLHKKEALDNYLPGSRVRVFIYPDNAGRWTASTKEATITLNQAAFLPVVDHNPKYGIFLDNHLIKHLLCSKDDLPFNLKEWPITGDRVFVVMKEKKGLLYGKPVGRKQIASYFSLPPSLEIGKTYPAWVQTLLPEGLVAFTEKGEEIFIHNNNTRQPHRLGQAVEARILKLTETNEYVGTLIEQKEIMLHEDGLRILAYMDQHNKEMPYTDQTNPEIIQEVFRMSKSAFKRALGALYKSGIVELTPEKTKKTKI
ncbi:MAG: S1-like domain-containing RNA-binding protein [Candidatus Izemoplasmatales bacterium]|nr:S1-like domain-containing RNA-binding protein [Candidatus Izemoplasmatales bacterium]MDD4987786.1 S1-like domain-containing RNA-binding protein [Candidatus Izemoplasmatales bacterium]